MQLQLEEIRQYIQENCKSLHQLNYMKKMTLPVDISQACQIHSRLTCHQRSLSQIHHLQQVTLPVDITRLFLSQTQTQCSRKPSKKDKITFPVIAASLSYVTEDLILQLESLKMILQDTASDYPSDKPASKNYFMKTHV